MHPAHHVSNDDVRMTEGGAAALARAAESVRVRTLRAYPGRRNKMAVTFRSCRSRTDQMPTHCVAFDTFRMVVLACRFCDSNGRVRARAPLATYRPAIDLPGTGRVFFTRETLSDATVNTGGVRQTRTVVLLDRASTSRRCPGESTVTMPEFFWAFRHDTPIEFESTYTRKEWASAEVRIGDMRAWPADMFARRVDVDYIRHPGTDTPRPRDPSTDPGWVRREDRWLPLCVQPDAVYVDFSRVTPREVINPALAVLARLGVTPTHRSIERYCAESGTSGDSLVAMIMDEAEAMGVTLPDHDPDSGTVVDWLEDLRGFVEVPGAAAIQVIDLTASGGYDFDDPVCSLRLGYLGRGYQEIPERRLRELSEQRRVDGVYKVRS